MTTAQDRIGQPVPPSAPDPGQAQPPRGGRTALTRGWIAVALVPVFFILAFAAGEGLLAALGYPGGNAPAWATVVSDMGALVVVLLPCLAAVWFGRRARREGERRGLVPAVIGTLIGLGWLVLTVITEVNDLVLR